MLSDFLPDTFASMPGLVACMCHIFRSDNFALLKKAYEPRTAEASKLSTGWRALVLI
jgi:hypothetical protein